MADFSELSLPLLHIALAGGLLLGLGALAARRCQEPVDRIRVIEWTFCGCLLLPVLQFCQWLPTVKLGWIPAPVSQEPLAVSQAPPPPASESQNSSASAAVPVEVISPAPEISPRGSLRRFHQGDGTNSFEPASAPRFQFARINGTVGNLSCLELAGLDCGSLCDWRHCIDAAVGLGLCA